MSQLIPTLLLAAMVTALISCGRSSTSFTDPTSFGNKGSTSQVVYPATFSGGAGTIGDPYRISTATDLMAMEQHYELWGKYFKVVSDIDLSQSTFTPYIDNFTGSFDGNGHTISNWTSPFPFFVRVYGTVKYLRLANATVLYAGKDRAGILAGTVTSTGTIDHCHVDGTLSTVGTAIFFVGGLVGGNIGTVQYSSAQVTLQGGAGVGGLAGYNSGHIYNSYANSHTAGTNSGEDINGVYGVGGLVGYLSGDIRDSFAIGSVKADRLVGGLVGYSVGTVTKSYAATTFDNTSVPDAGGLIGRATGAAVTTDSFWDSQVSTLGVSGGGSSATTAQLQLQATFTNWNFSTNWYFPNTQSYPQLIGAY